LITVNVAAAACVNGATNPPTCDTFPPCVNGATNPPACDTFPPCVNGATNPPTCDVFLPADGYCIESCDGTCNQITCKEQCTRAYVPPQNGGADHPCSSLPASYTEPCSTGACSGNGVFNIIIKSNPPDKIIKNRSTVITWESTGADICTGSTNNSEPFDTGGLADNLSGVTVSPDTTTTYTLTCENITTGVTQSEDITIKVISLNIIDF